VTARSEFVDFLLEQLVLVGPVASRAKAKKPRRRR